MSYFLTEGGHEVYSYTRKEKRGGENFTMRSFIVCTHQLIWLGHLNQGGQIGRASSLHGKMANAYTLVSCVKGGYIIEWGHNFNLDLNRSGP
jgi:hypothetical protein